MVVCEENSLLDKLLNSISQSKSILPFIPVWLKYTLLFVLALNLNSFPFIWHVKTFGNLYWFSIKDYFSPQFERVIGTNPFKTVAKRTLRATLDDCDLFGYHLSNSSYAKNVDPIRLDAWTNLVYSLYYYAKVWTPLASSSYNFIKEIPAGKKYDVRISMGGWEDEKWFYYVAKFVSKKSKKSKSAKDLNSSNAAANVTAPGVDVSTPKITPNPSSTHLDKMNEKATIEAYNELADDEELNCVVVSQYCFKCGRITVPPPVALKLTGLGKHGENNYKLFQKLVNEKKLKNYLRGGYKDTDNEYNKLFNISDLEEENSKRKELYKTYTRTLNEFKYQ